jgi:epoxyqueuosine reductase QueG
MIVEEIRKIAEGEDIPVLGIGPASKMANESPGYRPEDLMHGARSLICFGIPVPRQVYQNLYYRRLDTLSLRLAALLEESGAQAVPVYGCMPLGINEKGEVVGYLNQIRMGEVTGIGSIGRNGLLLHSRYGARLMLGGVVTSAALPDMRHPDVDQPGCPPGCRICVEACPVKAISPEEKRVNIMRCLGYTARTPLMSRLKFAILRAYRRESAARLMNLTAFDEHTFHICSRCVALCPYGDETAD